MMADAICDKASGTPRDPDVRYQQDEQFVDGDGREEDSN